MWQKVGLRRVREVLAGHALLLMVACQSPGSQRIVGPDGSAMAHVHCGADQGVCFRMAGELCPTGYEIKPVLRGSDGNFLVRCRAPAAATVAAGAPCTTPERSPAERASAERPSAAIVTNPRAPGARDDRWPPSTEPAPATYPWPPAQTSAAAHSPSTVPNQAELDLGY